MINVEKLLGKALRTAQYQITKLDKKSRKNCRGLDHADVLDLIRLIKALSDITTEDERIKANTLKNLSTLTDAELKTKARQILGIKDDQCVK
jgi:phosphoribosylaminoimidazole carboxylase (NCAIR synthetase)